MKKKIVRRAEVFLHLVTSSVLILKSADEFGKRLYFPGGILLGLALCVLCLLFLWRRLAILPRHARVACYYIEAPALFVTAYVFSLEQKELLTYLFLLSAILYPAVGFVSSKKFKRIKKAGM